jgi:aspartate/glutamate racemase
MLAEVKVSSNVCDGSLERLDGLCVKLRQVGVETILLGCTELSGLRGRIGRHGLKVIDSNQALAESALDLIMNGANAH